MSTKTWWEWQGSVEHEHGRATYFCGTVNEVAISLPNFGQAQALANAIEAQATPQAQRPVWTTTRNWKV